MCGLYGFSDPYGSLGPQQVRQLVRALAVSSMVRGTDAIDLQNNNTLHSDASCYATATCQIPAPIVSALTGATISNNASVRP